MSETHTDSTPQPAMPRWRWLIPILAGLIIAGLSFWWGYEILRGMNGMVGEGRRFTNSRMMPLEEHLKAYHAEHGVYPESLRMMLEEHYAKQGQRLDNDVYTGYVTPYIHPVAYERTDAGWRLTEYGADGKPGGEGLDADMVFTSDMDEDAVIREAHGRKYHATFAQVRAADDGSYFAKLVRSSLMLGGLVFLLIVLQFRRMKQWSVLKSVLPAIAITIAAGFVGMVIMLAGNIASGH